MEKFYTLTNIYGSINIDNNIVSQLIERTLKVDKNFSFDRFKLSKNQDGYYELEVFLKNRFSFENSKSLERLHKNIELTFRQALDLRNIMVFINISA